MTATLRASTPSYTSAASDTTFAIAMPTGWQPGDVVDIGIECRGTGASVTTPTGWTAVAPVFNPVGVTNTCLVVLRRVMQAGDADPLTITVVSSRVAAIAIAAVGADNTTPEDGVTPSEAAQSAATNSPVANSVTPNGSDDLLLTFFGAGDPVTANVAMTFTQPTGTTLVAQASTGQAGATDAGIMIASLVLTSNAPTATQTATITPSSGTTACNSQAVTLVLKSAAAAGVTFTPQRYGQAAPPSMVPWSQKDLRNALLVATAANPLPSPLDVTWGANGPYSHLYSDTAVRDRRQYFYQRSYVSVPGAVDTPANPLVPPLDSAWQADAQYWHLYNDPKIRESRVYFAQRLLVSDPSLLVSAAADPLTLNPEQSNSSDMWRVAIVPAFYDRREVPQQRAYYDPALLATALLENELLGGAETFKRYGLAATHVLRWWMPQQPSRLADPLLIVTALLETPLLGGGDTMRHYLTAAYADRREVPQQRAYVSDPLLLLTALLENELLGGGDTFKRYGLAATHADRRQVPQQRQFYAMPGLPLDPTVAAWNDLARRYLLAATHRDRRLYPAQRLYYLPPPPPPPPPALVPATGSATATDPREGTATVRRLTSALSSVLDPRDGTMSPAADPRDGKPGVSDPRDGSSGVH